MALYDGTVQDRYDREYLRLLDDRKMRGFDHKHVERRTREYVDPDAIGGSAAAGNVTGTASSTGDNDHGPALVINPA